MDSWQKLIFLAPWVALVLCYMIWKLYLYFNDWRIKRLHQRMDVTDSKIIDLQEKAYERRNGTRPK